MTNKFLVYGAVIAGFIFVATAGKKTPATVSTKPKQILKYDCNYVKLIGTDDQIRTYIFKFRNEYLLKNPAENSIDTINFINLTGYIVDKISSTKQCFILFVDRQLSKEQALLLYTFLAYMNLYSTIFGIGENETVEVDELYESKLEELRKYLNINMVGDGEYQKIISGLAKNREYYIM